MSGSNELGFEKKLFVAANKLRSNMDAAEYKHVVLGLVFLKYVSDTFEELHAKLKAHPEADEEDEDEYTAQKTFWVPNAARWSHLQANARQPEIGQIIDDAMRSIEHRNSSLRGVLTKDYARPGLNKAKLGELVDLIGTIGLGGEENQSNDVLGKVYEYFLGEFASMEGKKGGQFYTPESVVRVLVEMLQPFSGRLYDPCCGTGGMFVQSERLISKFGFSMNDVSIFAQESNPTTWKLFKMNMAMRRINANVGSREEDTLLNDIHPDIRMDYVLANPPFNMKEWGYDQIKKDARWVFSVPPEENANFAWLQHIYHHLKPGGRGGIVLSNNSLSSDSEEEISVRKGMIDGGIVECIVALPPNIFYNTGIAACLWIIRKPSSQAPSDTSYSTLLIDARDLGIRPTRKRLILTDEDISLVSSTFSSWLGRDGYAEYTNHEGFCQSVAIQDIADNDYNINPGRYTVPPAHLTPNPKIYAGHLAQLKENIREAFQTTKLVDGDLERMLGED